MITSKGREMNIVAWTWTIEWTHMLNENIDPWELAKNKQGHEYEQRQEH